ncbi:hypothetical protein [Kineosporia babensis]|uniref:Uncharacterized protein n=1 Tax=Kineosporia babensis TaxID=499548 RepID=A0A9X1NGK2_9ACTN|nr:hypothetical protein [Kineosporia babensis]MCD5312906.1 hypothetical protein [Kineosporia babensis]
MSDTRSRNVAVPRRRRPLRRVEPAVALHRDDGGTCEACGAIWPCSGIISTLRTGRVELPLVNGRGYHTGVAITAAIMDDLVIIWAGDRTLAVLHRAPLADWLWHPAGRRLIQDDIVLYDQDGRLGLTIDEEAAYFVDDQAVETLRSVIMR